MDQRCMNSDVLLAFDTGACGQIGHVLKGGDVLGAAVGVAAVVCCVYSDEDVE